jgi:hypothetical protein
MVVSPGGVEAQLVPPPPKWPDWLSTIVSTVSKHVLLNSVPGERIHHARWLRQGDPLSPFLFLLVMEVLGAMIKKAEEWSIFKKLLAHAMPHRASLYVDDLIIFLLPVPGDLELIKVILATFGGVSRLCCNMNKSEIMEGSPCCVEEDVGLVDNLLPCHLSHLGRGG